MGFMDMAHGGYLLRRDFGRERLQLSRHAVIRAASLDLESRSVEIVIGTERAVRDYDYRRREEFDHILRMDGAEFPEQVPFCDSHVSWANQYQIGSVRDIRIEGDSIVGRAFYLEGDERAERCWQLVAQGHARDVSLGAWILAFEDVERGKDATINGKFYRAEERRIRVATKWRLFETSQVPVGADEAAKVRGLSEGVGVMNKELRAYLVSRGMDAGLSDEEALLFYRGLSGDARVQADRLMQGTQVTEGTEGSQVTQAVAPVAAVVQAAAPGNVVDLDSARREAASAERARIAEIRRLGAGLPDEIVSRAVNEGWDVGRSATTFLQALRDGRSEPVGAGVGIVSRGHERDCTLQTLTAGLLQRSDLLRFAVDLPAAERDAAERNAELGRRYRDMAMIDICREACRLDNRAVGYGRGEIIRAAVSGGSLSYIFTTVVNAQLMQSYTEAPDTTAGWIRETEVADFKMNERARMGKAGGLSKLGRGDTAKHTSWGDEKEQFKIARYANQFVVDEQDIIDDRYDVLIQMPTEMGIAARRIRPDMVYAILLANAALSDSVALFHSTHANLGEAGTALAAPTLQAGITAMAKHTKDGVNLNISPAFLLVPQDLFFTAQILLASAERVVSADSGGTYNPLKDLNIQLRADNRLGVAGVTDPDTGTAHAGTATNWFLVANPAVEPTIEVAYLRGTGRAPMVRSFVLDRGQYGVGWDVKLDIGAKALAYRGMYKATGAS